MTKLIGACYDIPDGRAVANGLYGLKGMSSEHAEVRLLVKSLSKFVAKCPQALSSAEKAMALYGLQVLPIAGCCSHTCVLYT